MNLNVTTLVPSYLTSEPRFHAGLESDKHGGELDMTTEAKVVWIEYHPQRPQGVDRRGRPFKRPRLKRTYYELLPGSYLVVEHDGMQLRIEMPEK